MCRLLIPSASHISVADLDAPPFDQNLRINASKIQDSTPKIDTFFFGGGGSPFRRAFTLEISGSATVSGKLHAP
jgi:hypothetical protein